MSPPMENCVNPCLALTLNLILDSRGKTNKINTERLWAIIIKLLFVVSMSIIV